MLGLSTTEGVEILCERVWWANPLEMRTLSVGDFSKIFHRGYMDFKRSSPYFYIGMQLSGCVNLIELKRK